MRVAVNSSVPFSALGDKERSERLSNLRFERLILNSTLKRAAEKLSRQKDKCIIAEHTLKHIKQAMTDLTTKSHHKKVSKRPYPTR